MRLQTRFEPAPPSSDDLLALVEAIRDVAGVDHGDEVPDMLREPLAMDQGSREDKYAPLRRRDHFTVITGEGGETQ